MHYQLECLRSVRWQAMSQLSSGLLVTTIKRARPEKLFSGIEGLGSKGMPKPQTCLAKRYEMETGCAEIYSNPLLGSGAQLPPGTLRRC